MIATCMDMTMAETLQAIGELRQPVVRTCHIGNTPVYNLGWLGLSANTYLGPLDHTLYGVDDIFYPWAVLGDEGMVKGCFDHRGRPVAELVGLHANALRHTVARKYRSYLNYGIFADYEGEDLISRHCRITAELASSLNGSATVPRAAEVLALRPMISDLIRRFHTRRRLDALFNRWVRITRRGDALMLKIARIEYSSAGDISIYTTDSDLNFAGSLEELIDSFFAGMDQVSERLASGRWYGAIRYPWITVFLNFLLNVIKEHDADPAQKVFWHGTATGNPRYMREPSFQHGVAELLRELEREGCVPAGAELRIIPTVSCQLFATEDESLLALEALVSCWREYIGAHRQRVAGCVAAFATADNPGEVAEELLHDMEPRSVQEIGRRLAERNAIDAHRLPIAYLPGSDHPTYNKYGTAQAGLRGRRILFPRELTAMTWGEAELLTRILARLVIDQHG